MKLEAMKEVEAYKLINKKSSRQPPPPLCSGQTRTISEETPKRVSIFPSERTGPSHNTRRQVHAGQHTNHYTTHGFQIKRTRKQNLNSSTF